jgi:hypothetical protein
MATSGGYRREKYKTTTPMLKNVGVLIMVLNCTLLNVFICGYIDCKNMNGLNNIKYGIGRFCTDAGDIILIKTMVCH